MISGDVSRLLGVSRCREHKSGTSLIAPTYLKRRFSFPLIGRQKFRGISSYYYAHWIRKLSLQRIFWKLMALIYHISAADDAASIWRLNWELMTISILWKYLVAVSHASISAPERVLPRHSPVPFPLSHSNTPSSALFFRAAWGDRDCTAGASISCLTMLLKMPSFHIIASISYFEIIYDGWGWIKFIYRLRYFKLFAYISVTYRHERHYESRQYLISAFESSFLMGYERVMI